MKKAIIIFTLFATPACALDLEISTPNDSTPATMILIAKALGIWDTISSQLKSPTLDFVGNRWDIIVEGVRQSCTGTYPSITCTPLPGYWAHIRYTGPINASAPTGIKNNITISGSAPNYTFAWKGSSPSPANVIITIDDHAHVGWL